MNKTNSIPYTLKSCILETIKHTTLHTEFATALLTQDQNHARNKNETEFWDYKEDIDFNKAEHLAKLSSIVLAFHNSQGGCIIFGIRNDYVVNGIYKSKIIDTVTLKNKLKKYIGNSVNIFQEHISIPLHGKVIYLIFVPKRKGQPIPVHSNGPDVKGVPLIKKNDHYMRIGDEVKVCREPADYDRLYLDASFKHISAYQNEVDIPYYRLLCPHHRRLIGRDSMISEIIKALNSRYFIISLVGVGGVGKTALAIETLKKIYGNGDDCNYQFIVSTSAKNKIWSNRTEVRLGEFSGLAELIEIIAQVFDINITGKSTNELKSEIIDLMSGVPGILFLDNIEDITDSCVWSFLKNDIPEPVKILVSSRITKDLGALQISVPEMAMYDARSLLNEELENFGYFNYINEEKEVNEILKATAYLPLAIKWAAQMINHSRNLKEVSSEFRKYSTTRNEFLNYCFATMYDSLSPIGKSTALCIPFLGENANSSNISMLLDKSTQDIDDAISELEEKGLLYFHSDIERKKFNVIPLTIDFLKENLNQDNRFHKKLIKIAADNEGIHLPKNQQVEIYYQRASMLENKGEDLTKASQLVSAALQTIINEGVKISQSTLLSLKYLDGKIMYRLKNFTEGILRMTTAIQTEENNSFSPDEIIFLVEAIFKHGSGKDDKALLLFAGNYSKSSIITKELIKTFIIRAKKDIKREYLKLFLKNLTSSSHAYYFVNTMWDDIADTQASLILGYGLIHALRLASNFNEIESKRKQKILTRIDELTELFKGLA